MEIGARPGQHPYEARGNEPERVKQDMAVIKAAGFNAIRTWSELSEEELQMVRDSGLKVVFGINIQPDQDFAAPEESPLLGLYAGADISYGKFVKTIHDQRLLYRGDWADPIRLR